MTSHSHRNLEQVGFLGVCDPLCLSSFSALHYFFPIILFGSTTLLLAGMTSITLHMQSPLTSQSHGSVSVKNSCFFPQIKLHAQRTIRFALVLQIFLGNERLVKNRLISTLGRQGNLLQGTIFQESMKPFFNSRNM
jgi:hypothetical protein